MIKTYLVILTFLCSFTIVAQDYFPKNDGVVSNNTNYTAITNAKIYVTPTQVIENGTLLIKDGKIVASNRLDRDGAIIEINFPSV